MNDEKVPYLEMVQNTIDKMSANSAILKGFAATVVTGISAISFTEIDKWVLLLSLIPVISFFALDVYYLLLERRFRYLYDNIRDGEQPVNYSMAVDIPKEKLEQSGARLRDCFRSPSILLFYLPVLLVVSAILAMKFGGRI